MRACTVARDTFSALASAETGVRASARSRATSRWSRSSICAICHIGRAKCQAFRAILSALPAIRCHATAARSCHRQTETSTMRRPHFLMTDPAHYAVSYRINPWMRPDAWIADAGGLKRQAAAGSRALAAALEGLGATVSWVPAATGLPDLVFPANAAVVLDGKAVLARFRKAERCGEEPLFAAAFERLRAEGAVSQIETLPAGCFHEGAGDAHWDRTRRLLWTGYGPRSSRAASDV